MDSTVYNDKTNTCSDISKRKDIYVEENKKENPYREFADNLYR